ncbi:hypothetical protein HPB52_000674 [Rhipicephalus sanguineus]|uniref:Uncharacterized protein n=1 Tax=Rhipicephalus sanguineus TaxID=34632 RepID=A0A9D4QEZ1_RHISA|nr:hypothetical protein HPB52_000674 [Rhipicephalus sanguineus]
MNASTFYGPRKAREKTTACDIPSGSEDSDLSDSDDDYPPGTERIRRRTIKTSATFTLGLAARRVSLAMLGAAGSEGDEKTSAGRRKCRLRRRSGRATLDRSPVSEGINFSYKRWNQYKFLMQLA